MTVSNQIPVKSVSLVISGPPTNGSLTSANTNSITADWDLPTDTGSGSNTVGIGGTVGMEISIFTRL